MPIKQTIVDNESRLDLQLNESQGDIVANSGNSSSQGADNYQDGRIIGDVERVTAPGGDRAAEFDRANERITIAAHDQLNMGNGSFSWSMQINPQSMDINADYSIMTNRESENGGSGFTLEKVSGQDGLTLTLEDSLGNVKTFNLDPSLIQEGQSNTLSVNIERSGRILQVDVQSVHQEQVEVNGELVNQEVFQKQSFGEQMGKNATFDSNSDLVIGSLSNDHSITVNNIQFFDGILSDLEVKNIDRVQVDPDGIVNGLLDDISPIASWNFDANPDSIDINNGFNYSDSYGMNDLEINNPNNLDLSQISTQGQVDHGVNLKESQTLSTDQNIDLSSDITVSAFIQTTDQNGVILEQMESSIVNGNQIEEGIRLSIKDGLITLQIADGIENGIENNVEFKLTSQQSATILNGSQEHLAVTVERGDTNTIEQVVFHHNSDPINSSPEVVDLINPANSQSQMTNPVSMGDINNNADLVIGNNLSATLDQVEIFGSKLEQWSINQLYQPSSMVIGANDIEADPLQGTSSNDLFVLGGANQTLYVGNLDNDYANIDNLTVGSDSILLSGDITQYEIQQIIDNGNVIGSSIALKDSVDPINGSSDLIANVLQGVDLTDSVIRSQVLDFA